MMFSSSSKFQGQSKSKMCKKWQLFHATDFQSLMYPCFITCRILGIFPYKINASTFKTSKQRYILPTFLICVFCICELLVLYKINNKIINFGDTISNLEASCYYIFGGFIVIITYVLSGPRMRVLQAMLEISSKLPPESYQKLSKWIHVKDILSTLFLVMQACIYHYKNRENYVGYVSIVWEMLALYIALVTFQMDMQYMNCVCVLKACFKRINDNLVHMQKIVIRNKPYAPTMICHMQNNQFLLIELNILKKQHLIVSDTVQMLNVMFNLQLLASIILTFTDTTFEVYFHVIRWQGGLSIILDDEIRNVFFIMSIAYDLMKLILIVWACETGKNQAFEIGTTIHDVLNCTSDKQIKEELQLFSLQILHRENIFSAKGLTVDTRLLAAMTGSITTYILILTQFLIISHSCDGKAATNITKSI